MKKSVPIIVLCILSFNLFAKTDSKVRLVADTFAFPYFYEISTVSNGVSLNGSLFVGATIKNFTVGGQLSENYVSLSNRPSSTDFQGSWNILRLTATGFYEPISWVEIMWGLGAAWLTNSFSYNNYGFINYQMPGVSLVLQTTFRPPFKHLEIQLLNRFDLFFHNKYHNPSYTSLKVTPYYYGGIRLLFHPYLDWVNLYLEVGGIPWDYSSIPYEVTTGIVTWGVGASIDIIIPETFKNTKTQIKTDLTNYKENKHEQRIEELKSQTLDEKLFALSQAQKGDIIVFNALMFEPDSDILLPESLPILERIASILLTRKDITIEVSGHTNSLGTPDEEYELSLKRSAVVAQFLVEHGVNPERVRNRGYGGLRPLISGIEEINRRVEITVLSTDKKIK